VFSKTERDYLSGLFSPTYAYKRVLDHRIKKKVFDFYKNEFPLIQKFSVSDFSNNVTEFSNNKIICEATRSPFSEGKRSLGRDTSTRPNAYEAFALPG
jgi:hypothetical protein